MKKPDEPVDAVRLAKKNITKQPNSFCGDIKPGYSVIIRILMTCIEVFRS